MKAIMSQSLEAMLKGQRACFLLQMKLFGSLSKRLNEEAWGRLILEVY